MTGTGLPPLPDALGPATAARPLSGGMIADVWEADLDGRRVIVKRTDYDARLEAEGLEALGAAGAAVPPVLGVSEDVLVLAHVEGDGDWHATGRRLATVHRSVGDAFGWPHANVIGPLPQDNTRTGHWPTFYVERRLRPRLAHPALPADVGDRLSAALEGPAQDLLDHGAAPSLVHGDLWSGNIIGGTWLIDPAVHHADREFDLAFADLFGGIPSVFWNGYLESWPLDGGWRERRPALQLYHLLVHVALFGSGYVGAVRSRLDRLGW